MKKVILCAAVLFLCLGGISSVAKAVSSPDIFGLEVGNIWQYRSVGSDWPSTAVDQVVSTTVRRSVKLYVIERIENGRRTERQWLEKRAGEVALWGGTADFQGKTYTMEFSAGLSKLWYPMKVGESRYSTAEMTVREITGSSFNASMKVDVIGRKQVRLSAGSVEGYKIRYQMKICGHAMEETATYVEWWVPSLGCVRYEDWGTVDKLVSFAIGGGSITPQTDRETLNEAILHFSAVNRQRTEGDERVPVSLCSRN